MSKRTYSYWGTTKIMPVYENFLAVLAVIINFVNVGSVFDHQNQTGVHRYTITSVNAIKF